jgi:hypothetical protein
MQHCYFSNVMQQISPVDMHTARDVLKLHFGFLLG